MLRADRQPHWGNNIATHRRAANVKHPSQQMSVIVTALVALSATHGDLAAETRRQTKVAAKSVDVMPFLDGEHDMIS